MSQGRSLDFQTAYAIVRIDKRASYKSALEVENSSPEIPAGEFEVTVKEVVMSVEEAQSEVKRLNKLRGKKQCRYFWQSTHLFLDGGSHGSKPNGNY